ncbi:MAG: nicotinamidase [Vicinamibacterales bacterium]
MPPEDALLIIDVQNDFCPGGALEVRSGDQVVAPLNRMIERARLKGEAVYATRDWHPPTTRHFRDHGGIWPAHCVAGSPGAEFHPSLALPDTAVVVTKGDTEDGEGYSAFEGRTPAGVPLAEEMEAQGVKRLYVGGLATDYCVRQSVLDALREGFEVTVLTDAVRGVDVQPGDSARALAEMKTAGADFRVTSEVLDDEP